MKPTASTATSAQTSQRTLTADSPRRERAARAGPESVAVEVGCITKGELGGPPYAATGMKPSFSTICCPSSLSAKAMKSRARPVASPLVTK